MQKPIPLPFRDTEGAEDAVEKPVPPLLVRGAEGAVDAIGKPMPPTVGDAVGAVDAT